jgi:hypothetical protein
VPENPVPASESGPSGIEDDLGCKGYPVKCVTVWHGGTQRIIAAGSGRTITYFRLEHIIKIEERDGSRWLSDVGVAIQEA